MSKVVPLMEYHDLLSIPQTGFWVHVVLMALGGYGTWNNLKKFCIKKVIASPYIVSRSR
jgi:hypothetical protein